MLFKSLTLTDFDFPKKIKIENIEFLINVIFSDKKNLSAYVKENEFIFRFPKHISKKLAQKHFDYFLSSMTNKVKKNPEKYSNNLNSKFEKILEEKKFIFNSVLFEIQFHNFKTIRFNYIGNVIFLNSKMPIKELIKLLEKFLSNYFLEFLENYIKELNEKTYNYNLGKISLKSLNSKWGHCTKQNDILINLKLLTTKREFLDYVIIHELSHCEFKNHSKNFWNNVKKFSPNYKEIEKEMKKTNISIF